ncbi:helix-turn-helix domain-containing protein [Sphingomonas aracearum]|nr:short-chain fatty acyl-CoA regulator family protein [Sphingomonas aracearum]
MPSRRTFAGPLLRDLRLRHRLPQAAMAARLGISASYLSQIEAGDRPVTPKVLAALAEAFPGDWAGVDPQEEAALLVDALAASVDPGIAGGEADEEAIARLVRQQPQLARRMAELHRAYRRSQEQVAVLDDRVEAGGREPGLLPWEQVRDWFHAEGNYVDPLDRAAEAIGETLAGDPRTALIERLSARFGVVVGTLAPGDGRMRAYQPARGRLLLDPAQPPETLLFALAHQLARHEFAEPIATIAAAAGPAAEELLAAGLTNYAAAALLMPYERFRAAAREVRHDIDRLRLRFGTSFEQTCHRLSTLQRPGAAGIPFFFCRVDLAGNITKRHSATRLQFARFGGACPLWIVHEAVAVPDRVQVQLAETPDGIRYVSMAKGLVKPSGSYTRPPRRYAVALGCEADQAGAFVYADGLNLKGAATPIGTSCRICVRTDCDQRAFPPASARIGVDPNNRGVVPYSFG